MSNFRVYGKQPYTVVVVHGGPGAPGSMAPLAKRLSEKSGVLEPLQTAMTVQTQIHELVKTIKHEAKQPVVLIGHSWGACLCYLVAANYSGLVKKMILIASGVFDEQHADKIMNTRLERLDKQEQKDFLQCVYKLNQPAEHNKNQLMQTLGELCTKADILNPLTLDTNLIKVDYVQYQSVWQGFLKLRQGGELLDSGLAIKCPVAAIHGDYDPHPAAGIKDVLSPIIKNFKFILLKKCGHYPWLEKDISTHFYQVLLDEIAC